MTAPFYCAPSRAGGNVTQDLKGRTFRYDAENMLLDIRPTGGGVIVGEYVYNPDGTRHYKRSLGTNGEQARYYHTMFPYDDGELAQEILETANNANWNLGANTVTRRFVRLPGSIDEAFLMIDYTVGNPDGGEAGKTVYAHFNRQGSVIATSNASGNVEDKYTYSPYGVSGGTNSGFPFRFTGQRLDAETGLYYYKARYYDSETGRFLQVDPIGYADQQNLYAYVGNDSINATDPTGEYRRGTGFSDKEWKKFDRTQKSAGKKLNKAADKLNKKADKLDKKGKEGGDKLRQQAELLRKGAEVLNGDANAANALSGDEFAARGKSEDVAAFVTNKDAVTINKDHSVWKSSGSLAQSTIAHEAFHTVGLSDQRGPNGKRAYRRGSKAQKRAYRDLKNTPKALINPDHIVDWAY